ncbi:hypothetical protein M404DRAFT_34908 [Pisolithus tinctorius Marx 270]|uniref:Uncharacterized protein n=1 Tax=Pisolithus tinctorius Marx 270 TaxID=870435 RepID=A0A0C3IBY4_PISTI|nr:hypothetical protein M404DRAFT_34908 [Pisolithus tinctorius Marx 270]
MKLFLGTNPLETRRKPTWVQAPKCPLHQRICEFWALANVLLALPERVRGAHEDHNDVDGNRVVTAYTLVPRCDQSSVTMSNALNMRTIPMAVNNCATYT